MFGLPLSPAIPDRLRVQRIRSDLLPVYLRGDDAGIPAGCKHAAEVGTAKVGNGAGNKGRGGRDQCGSSEGRRDQLLRKPEALASELNNGVILWMCLGVQPTTQHILEFSDGKALLVTSAVIMLPLLTASVAHFGGVDDERPYVPPAVEDCLKQPAVKPIAELVSYANPFYLRGDFDGDGKPDYAIAVRGPKTKRNGVLFCLANKTTHVVGADKPLRPPFSDMPADNFVAPNWEVFTKADVVDLKRFDKNVPNPVPRTVGEAVAMVWEDGIALIYWNGTRFLWAGSNK